MSSASRAVRSWEIVRPLAVSGRRLLGRLELADRRKVLVPLVGASWALTAALALSVIPHHGWLYATGSNAGADSWTSAWAIVHGVMPPPLVPYGLPVLYAPLALLAGANVLAGLPALVLIQVGLLAPVAVVGVFAIADRLGGRLFACTTAALWVLAPLLVLLFYDYPWSRAPLEAQALPTLLGLTAAPAYPSMVIAIVAAFLVMRALEEGRAEDAVLAGLLFGFLIALDPGNGFFLLAPALAFPAARRGREAALFAAGVALPLLVLLLWDADGASLAPMLHHPLRHLLGFRWSAFTTNLIWLRKDAWSVRIVEWLMVAGVVGALRRGLAVGALVGGWAVAFLVLEGGTPAASVENMTYLPSTQAGLPAYVILAACIVFLLPGSSRAQGSRLAARAPLGLGRRTVTALALAVVIPVALVAVAQGSAKARTAVGPSGLLVPVSAALALQVSRTATATHLSWRPQTGGSATVVYDVFRSKGDGCVPGPAGSCRLSMRLVAQVPGTSWQGATTPGADYRIGVVAIGVVAAPAGRTGAGNLVLVSNAVGLPPS